jgi:hypothetical protein
MTGAGTRPFGRYGFTLRTFRVNVTDLIVSRSWYPEKDAGVRLSITGKAVSEDSASVIGRGEETKEFYLTIKSDEAAKSDWEREKSTIDLLYKNDGSTPELRVSAHISETLSQKPPTATLFVTDDNWEFGTKGGWSIECDLPMPVLAQLADETIALRTRSVYMGIKWVAGLVRDEHAPLGIPTSWGLFTINEEPQPLRGHVTMISWRVSDRAPAPDEPAAAREQTLTRSSIEEEIHHLGEMLAGHTLSLMRACTIGFLGALALLLVSFFLR